MSLTSAHRPFEARRDCRALDQPAVDPLEALLAVRIADQQQIAAIRRRGRPGSLQRRRLVDRAVAILALDFDRAHDFGLDVAVAVIVLGEVAVDALHADIDVDRLQVHGLLPLVRIVVLDDLAILVEQVALAVARIDAAEIPAVAVIVGELRVVQLRVEQRDVAHEVDVAPLAADRRFFRIAVEDLALLRVGRIFLLLRPHERRVGFVVPHRVADHRVDEHVRLMHVADHALAGRDLARELVLDRMSRLVLRNRRIDLLRSADVAGLRVNRRVERIAVVGVDHVASRATRRTIVAGIVVRAHQPDERIIESRLVNVEHRDRNAVAGAGTAVRLLEVRAAGFFEPLDLAGLVGQADFREQRADIAAAALEHAEDVGNRCRLPARHRIDLRQDAVRGHVRVRRDLRIGRGRQCHPSCRPRRESNACTAGCRCCTPPRPRTSPHSPSGSSRWPG